eukprot:scaffold5106_cov248-Pinguiococcus_pyrenoidosus.AAC.5
MVANAAERSPKNGVRKARRKSAALGTEQKSAGAPSEVSTRVPNQLVFSVDTATVLASWRKQNDSAAAARAPELPADCRPPCLCPRRRRWRHTATDGS